MIPTKEQLAERFAELKAFKARGLGSKLRPVPSASIECDLCGIFVCYVDEFDLQSSYFCCPSCWDALPTPTEDA